MIAKIQKEVKKITYQSKGRLRNPNWRNVEGIARDQKKWNILNLLLK